jgi:hypothetical protein
MPEGRPVSQRFGFAASPSSTSRVTASERVMLSPTNNQTKAPRDWRGFYSLTLLGSLTTQTCLAPENGAVKA